MLNNKTERKFKKSIKLNIIPFTAKESEGIERPEVMHKKRTKEGN